MKVLTDNKYYGQIADVIREQNGTSNTYTPPQMVSALKDLFYEEVEGVPPISFNGIGENLLDYRIDGASGGVGERTKNLCPYNKVNNSIIAHVESGKTYSFSLFASFLIGFNLMKRNASSQSTSSVATKYNSEGNVSVTFTADEDFDLFVNGFSSISGKTFLESVSNFQLEESSTVTDYEPYGYKVPVVVSGKNLFDGIYGANHFSKIEPDKTITISTKSTGESSITFVYKKSDGTRFKYTRLLNENETSGSATVTTPSEAVGIGIYAATDYTSQTIAYDTLIEYGDRATDYEPYHEPTTTNIYLDEPIGANERISLSDTNVNIPTIRGTNVLTVDTTIQPSNVYVKSRHESSYETAMRERYEEAQAQLDALESGGE